MPPLLPPPPLLLPELASEWLGGATGVLPRQ